MKAHKKVATLLTTTLAISLTLIGCKESRMEREIHQRIEAKITEAMESNHYKDYKPIKFSQIYEFSVINEEIDSLKNILVRNVSQREIVAFRNEHNDEYDFSDKAIAEIIAETPLYIFMVFYGGGRIKYDAYKEIIYRDNTIRENKLTPRNYIVFHKFGFTDKYNDAHTECIGVLVDSIECHITEISPEVKSALGF